MAEDNGNGRVTVAVLIEKMGRMERSFDRIENKLDDALVAVQTNRDDISRADERVKNLRSDVDALNRRSNTVDTVVGLATALAIFLGFNRP